MAKKSNKKKSSMREKARARAEGRKNSSGGGSNYLELPDDVEFFSAKKGTNLMDIIPYEVVAKNHPEVDSGEEWYQRTIYVHNNIGSEERRYLCPKTISKKCPICEHVTQMYKNNVDKDTINNVRAKERELFNIYDVEEDKILLFESSYYTFGQKLEEEIREGEDEIAGFAELADGFTLKVRYNEKTIGEGGKFLEASRIDFEPRQLPDDLVQDAYDLDALLIVPSYDDLQKAYLELDDDTNDEEEEEEEEQNAKTGRRNTSRRSKRNSDDDDDGNDDGDDSSDNESDDWDDPNDGGDNDDDGSNDDGESGSEESEDDDGDNNEEGSDAKPATARRRRTGTSSKTGRRGKKEKVEEEEEEEEEEEAPKKRGRKKKVVEEEEVEEEEAPKKRGPKKAEKKPAGRRRRRS